MTVPAKYSLTDAHWIIADLTKALKRIESNVGWGDYYACICVSAPNRLKECDCAPRLRQIARDALKELEEVEPLALADVHWTTLRERVIIAEGRVNDLENEMWDKDRLTVEAQQSFRLWFARYEEERNRADVAEDRVKELVIEVKILQVEVKILQDDLRDYTNDEIQTDRALHEALDRCKELEKALRQYGKHNYRHAFHSEDGCWVGCEVCKVLERKTR